MKKLLLYSLALLIFVFQFSSMAVTKTASAETVSDDSNVKVKNGTINLEKGTATYVKPYDTSGETYEIRLSRNTNSKYSTLIKEVQDHFGAAVLYPDAYVPTFIKAYLTSYDTFNSSDNVKFLVGLADKYKLCSESDTDKKKKRTVLAIYYGLYNDKDGIVNYKNSGAIPRKEFYALLCKANSTLDDWDERDINTSSSNDVSVAYRRYSSYILGNGKGITNKFVSGNISRFEADLIIASEFYTEEDEELIYVSRGDSIQKYCKDIKKSQILSYDQFFKKFPKAKNSISEFYNACVNNKVIPSFDHNYLLSAYHHNILITDSKGNFNLFKTINYDQALSYIMTCAMNPL